MTLGADGRDEEGGLSGAIDMVCRIAMYVIVAVHAFAIANGIGLQRPSNSYRLTYGSGIISFGLHGRRQGGSRVP